MDEMHVHAVDLDDKLRVAIEPLLARLPVERLEPMALQAMQKFTVTAQCPTSGGWSRG
ncbi:hypothetical protein D3C84_1167220 [compost metagenome]